jgi:hypothetical protein
MYNRYLKSYAGVDPTTGNALWYVDTPAVDDKGNPVLDDKGNQVMVTKGGVTSTFTQATSYETGDILPKIFGGFGTELKAYGVDLSVAFNYQAGGRIFDTGYQRLMHAGSSSDAGMNWHMDILGAVKNANGTYGSGSLNEDGTINIASLNPKDIPALNSSQTYANGTSDRWLISSNYVALQNITLGYTFPAKLTKKAHIEKIRLYAVADNVALWAARKGLDPRQSFTSANSTYYSPMRTISGGVSITF